MEPTAPDHSEGTQQSEGLLTATQKMDPPQMTQPAESQSPVPDAAPHSDNLMQPAVQPTVTPQEPPPPPPQGAPVASSPPAAGETKPKKNLFLFAGIFILVLLFLGGLFYYYLSVNKKDVGIMSSDTPTVDAIKTSGKIVIGTDATFPPMEFINETGEYTGYDIDLGKRIAEKMGVVPEFKQILFDNFIDELDSHAVDIVISSVSITEERKQRVQFSDPYLYAGQVIITQKENNSITSTADLQGKKIAVQRGTTNEEQARSFTSDDLILLYDDYELATQALLDGTADAIFSDLTGAKGIVDANPSLKVASEPFTQEAYGIVFRLGEDDAVQEINSILNSLRQQGILIFLKQKWLE